MRADEKKAKDIPIFLGSSPNGVVEGDVVYANFGTEENFRNLKAMVSVKDKIVLMRGGRIFRGNKVCTKLFMMSFVQLAMFLSQFCKGDQLLP